MSYQRITPKDSVLLFNLSQNADNTQLYNYAYRLWELENQIAKGELLKLPAPLGSELWTIEYPTHKIGKETVTTLSAKRAMVEKYKYPLSFSNLDMVGKYYFLTKAEAEQKLKELQGETE